MTEGVTIILPAAPAPDLVRRLAEAFPEATLVSSAPAADTLARVEAAAFDATSAAPALIDRLAALDGALERSGGLIGASTLALLALVIGAVVPLLLDRWRSRTRETGPHPFAARLRRAARRLGRRLLLLALFAVLSTLAFRLLLPAEEAARLVFRAALGAALFGGVLHALCEALLAPRDHARRPMGLGDADARFVLRAVDALILLGTVSRFLGALFAGAAAGDGSAALWVALLALLNAAAAAAFFFVVRRPIEELISRAPFGGRARTWFARSWWLVYAALAALNGLVVASGALGLLGPGAESGANGSLAAMILAPLAVAGLRVLREDAGPESRSDLALGGFAAAEGAVAVVAGAIILLSWGLDPLATEAEGLAGVAPRLLSAGIVLVVGVALWRAASALLRRRIKAPGGGIANEEAPAAASRMETLAPVLGGALFGVIAVVTAMTALSTLGVDIAPLLASAGVLGLAIGFGAQKLVADIISGVFYLYEDAFRLGEYVETSEGKGVVEAISVRSARLRHHRGPVFTIPFSSMGTIQNHSRDWVKVKFTFEVPVETDVEMVRKLVKKVGEALAADPELEGKFLEPLKSQGAIGIRNNAFEIGCKFTCRPGQQFLIRRKAYATLQKTLQERGVALYTPRFSFGETQPPHDFPQAAQ